MHPITRHGLFDRAFDAPFKGMFLRPVRLDISLDSDIDEGKVEAKYADGVLKLKLPKKAASAARRITVS